MRQTILIFLLITLIPNSQQQKADSALIEKAVKQCYLRCVAKCLENETCQQTCKSYGQADLCNKDEKCWRNCKDLGISNQTKFETSPENFNVEFNADLSLNFKWLPVDGAKLYVIQYRAFGDRFSKTERISNFMLPSSLFCSNLEFRVAALDSESGAGSYSGILQLEKAHPKILPKLHLQSIVYDKNKFEQENYESNGTIVVTLEYILQKWLFEDEDLEVVPLFHMMNCADPDTNQAIPFPEFFKGPKPNTIQTKLGADMMYRKCRFVYAVQEVRSKQCAETYHILASNSDYTPLEITCDVVTNCQKIETFKGPVCGQEERFEYHVVNQSQIDWSNKNSNITVNVTFVEGHRRSFAKSPIYYVALIGNASDFRHNEERSMLGVNMTKIIDTTSNCRGFFKDGTCHKYYPSLNSIMITNLNMDKLYGVIICGVIDPRNLTFPTVNNITKKHLRTRANPILISSAEFRKSENNNFWYFGAFLAILSVILLVAFFYWNQHKIYKKNIEKIGKGKSIIDEERYTDLPIKYYHLNPNLILELICGSWNGEI